MEGSPPSNGRSLGLELTTLYEVSKILAGSLDFTQSLQSALHTMASYLGLRRCTVSLTQEEGGELSIVAASGLGKEQIERGRFRPGEGIIGQILKNETPVVLPDVTQEPAFLSRTGSHVLYDGEVVAFIGVPIKASGMTVGVLTADRAMEKGRKRDLDGDLRLLSMVANLVGQTVALHRAVASERAMLLNEINQVQKQEPAQYDVENVVGVSKIMREVFAEVRLVAPSTSTVLLRGESGTGKELIARGLHRHSSRSDGPFVKLNCAALSETLLESELFGHEKGAFTGATQTRKGRFEQAHGGTLFLDEIGEISPAFQAKLLRVLQEREFERVGGNRTLEVDTRVVCATNRNLEQMVAAGTFRADLYYRINVVSIFLPPLRERRDDIAPLAKHFLAKYDHENDKAITISDAALEVLSNCYWPGNVRELQNCVERMATTVRGNVIDKDDCACTRGRCFSSVLWQYQKQQAPVPDPTEPGPQPLPGHPGNPLPPPMPGQPFASALPTTSPSGLPPSGPPSPPSDPPASEPKASGSETMPEDPREKLIWAMERSGWVQAKAGRLLGLTPRQIGYALKKHGIPLKRF